MAGPSKSRHQHPAPTIRNATAADSEAVSAIQMYYARTSATMSTHGQSGQNIRDSFQLMTQLSLPHIVATVPLASPNPNPKTRTRKNTTSSTEPTLELPLSESERQSGERIVGYAITMPHQMALGIDGLARTAEIYVYVAPGHVRKGIGTALISRIVMQLKGLGTPGMNGLEARWRSLVAVMVARPESGDEDKDCLDKELSPVDYEGQTSVWLRFGFEEAGRLKGVLEKNGRWRDIRYFQMDLLKS